MGRIEATWRDGLTRRRALVNLGTLLATSPLLRLSAAGQLDPNPLSAHKRPLSIDEIVTAFDFEPIFRANVNELVYAYTAHGDGSEFTLRRNREAFSWVDIIPKAASTPLRSAASTPSGSTPAVDPTTVDLSSDVLGVKMKYPIFIAPTAAQLPLHPDGEVGMRRGALAAASTPMILSGNTSLTVERVAAGASGGTLWWQHYPQQDPDTMRENIERAQAAGFSGVVVTVDQNSSFYERTQHLANLGGNPRVAGGRGGGRAGGRGGAAAGVPTGAARYRIAVTRLWYTWTMIDQVRAVVKGPMLVKGILTAEDARRCLDHGVDGIIVSNHGGRSMDYGPSTLEVLPEIAEAINGRIPILIDSGVRRGSDIFKALALGANAVCLGRASRWALGAFGAPGVQRLLEIMQRELEDAAAGAGCTTLASINTSRVKTKFV